MRALDLDFLPRRFSRLGIVCLGAGLLVAAAVMVDYQVASTETETWRAQLERLEQPARRRPAPRTGDDRELQQMAQAARVVAADLQRPWNALFAALEAAQPEDVALLALQPDVTRSVIRISGEARQREAILAYIARLEAQKVLRNVFLVEDQIQQQDPEKPIRFLISADWAGAP